MLLISILERIQSNASPMEGLMNPLLEFADLQHPDQGLSFYHTDHLGSSSWITGNNGRAEQHFLYLPFGEPWIDLQYSGSQTTYFTFSGKERDPETGYGYFGARYYSSDLSIWLSVDPMAGKYPSWSPYVYCADNPVKLVDPNGETPRIYVERNGVGHAFMTTGEGKNTTVYTYGRYLGGGKGKASSNSIDPTGRGVLVKLTGKEAQRYIGDQLKNKNAQAYELIDASDEKIDTHFDNLFSSGRELTSDEASKYDGNPNNYGSSEDARVIDTYDLLDNNCVSKTIDGARVGGTKERLRDSEFVAPDIPNREYQPISPAGLGGHLEGRANTKSSNVKNVTTQMRKEFGN